MTGELNAEFEGLVRVIMIDVRGGFKNVAEFEIKALALRAQTAEEQRDRLVAALREAQGCLNRISLQLTHAASMDVLETEGKIDHALAPFEGNEETT
jgi:hypothetical protein